MVTVKIYFRFFGPLPSSVIVFSHDSDHRLAVTTDHNVILYLSEVTVDWSPDQHVTCEPP